MADLVELSAPTPWLILTTTDDYFTPEGPVSSIMKPGVGTASWGGGQVRFFIGPGPQRNSTRNSGSDL